MLKTLKIQNYVIIEDLAIDFQSALTILTGETGAGKSILLGAMGLVLGEASNSDSIRSGSPEANIDAEFSPPKSHPVWELLVKKDMASLSDDGFTIHRTIRRDKKEDVLFNGKPVELEVLKEIGRYLVEIHGQFANQNLLGPENQLHLLDMSGDFPPEVFKNVAAALHEVHRITKELEDEKAFLIRHKRELRHIEQTVRAFDDMGMEEGFIEELEEEYATLLTAKETSEAFQAILAQLISGGGVVVALSTANLTLSSQKNLEHEKMEKLAGHLKTALENARAAVTEMNVLAPEYEIDTEPLHECKRKLDTLRKIAMDNKLEYSPAALTELYFDFVDKLGRLRNGRKRIGELEAELQTAKGKYLEHAHVLTEKRMEAAKKLSKAITAELPPLKLPKAIFEVEVKEDASMEWTELGLNKVRFMVQMNPGQEFTPLAETASGGELARMILGLKVVLQEVQTTPTLVFDEVDTGIGGAAAAAVGERLALLAEDTQVLVITHSPQVASRGDQHLHVSKSTDGITTSSNVRSLTMDDRIDEISRMLAGDTLTDESQAAAKSLIAEASKAAQARKTGTGAQH